MVRVFKEKKQLDLQQEIVEKKSIKCKKGAKYHWELSYVERMSTEKGHREGRIEPRKKRGQVRGKDQTKTETETRRKRPSQRQRDGVGDSDEIGTEKENHR